MSGLTELKFATRTVVGTVRKNNEDSVVGSPTLCAVADGVGGRPAGEVASRIAVETVAAAHRRGVPLRECIGIAQDVVRHSSEANSLLHTMLATCTAAAIDDGELVVCHVGDSRAYLLQGGKLLPLTIDQNAGNRLRLSGDPEAAAKHRNPASLYQVVGSHKDELEIMEIRPTVESGDRLLLCTDGLSGSVEGDRLLDLASADDLDTAADSLIEAALESSRDNITVALIEIP